MNSLIHTVEDLEAQTGTRPGAADLKVIDRLDAHAQRWLAASPLAFAGFSDARQISITLAGGAPGFASALDASRLRLPRGLLDDSLLARPGCGAGLLFLVPGLGETLRINGKVLSATERDIVIAVQECYAHCAKSLRRSAFWQAGDIAHAADAAAFLAACRFMAVATADTGLHTDVSPKGDPAGLLAQRCEDGIRFADRPGNRRMDSFRNLLSRPQAAAVLVVPGSTQVAMVQGATQLSADPLLRQAFAVQDKIPALIASMATPGIALRESGALVPPAPWTSPLPPADIDPAAIFAAHVRQNKSRGLVAMLAKGVACVPGLMRMGLREDYKRKMY